MFHFQLSIEQIRQHFSLFGGIKSLTVSLIDSSRHVFIDYENAQSAQTSVVNQAHRINEKLVNVHMNENFSTFFNINLSLIPQHQESPKHLLNSIPDECFLKVFEFLREKDLSNAADTYNTFRRVAKEVFKKQFADMSHEPTIDSIDARTLARLLRNFGPSIKSFVLNCKKMEFGSEKRYLELFFRHIGVPGSSLESLKIMNFNRARHMEFSKPIDTTISRLKSLQLQNCEGLKFSFGVRSTGRKYRK